MAQGEGMEGVEWLRSVTLPGRAGVFDIGLAGGRIVAVDPVAGPSRQTVLPLLADIHVHFDKAYTVARTGVPTGGLLDAIDRNQRDAQGWTAYDIAARATRALETAYRFGVGAVRSHVDWTGAAVPKAWPVLVELAREWRGRVTLQLASLTPVDVLAAHGGAIAKRVRQDGGVLGGFLYRHADAAAHVEAIFRTAREYDLNLDFHVDEGLDEDADGFGHVVDATLRHGMAGRVVCGHVCSLTNLTETDLSATLARAAEAGLALTALPTTNLHLQDRRDGRTPRRRGIAPIHEARAAGLPVMLGCDNCQDPFYPYGDFDPLKVLELAVPLCHVDPDQWIDSITTIPQAVGGFGLSPVARGAAADFILIDVPDLNAYFRAPHAARRVFRGGRAIADPEKGRH